MTQAAAPAVRRVDAVAQEIAALGRRLTAEAVPPHGPERVALVAELRRLGRLADAIARRWLWLADALESAEGDELPELNRVGPDRI